MRYIWLLPLLVLLVGCPQPTSPVADSVGAEFSNNYLEFKNALTDEDGFRDELKRLQGLYTQRPGLGNAPGGAASSIYTLSSRVEDGRVGLELTNARSEEQWVLWLWQDAAVSAGQLTVIEDEHTAGGYRLEFNVKGSTLTVNINARWLQGRYLQVRRELILGGLDHTLAAPDSYVAWELDGPWLPYRMVPALDGPYGVVRDGSANGEWQGHCYPYDCMVPAAAAFDKERGMTLMVVDEHPRRLDREYDIDYRIAENYGEGSQLRLTYRTYYPATDEFRNPQLFSGLAARDSVVLEPFQLFEESIDSSLVYAETDEVISLLGQLVRSFHFVAAPPERSFPGGFIYAGDWVDDPVDIPEFLRVASGIWDVKLSGAGFYDGTLEAGGNVGLGAGELAEGTGISTEALANLGLFQPDVMPVVASLDYLSFSSSPVYAGLFSEWLTTGEADGETGSTSRQYLEVRKQDASAWVIRKMSADITEYPGVAGYCLAAVPELQITGQPQPGNGYLMSYGAAASAVMLKTAEEVRTSRDDTLIVTTGPLSLAIPAFGNFHINRNPRYGGSSAQVEAGSGEEHSNAEAGVLEHAERFSNAVLWEVFGAAPCLDFGSTLAHQVLASSRTTFGHVLHDHYEVYPGFNEFACHQRELREAGGEFRVIHSHPLQAAYTVGVERPAACEELVAILPAAFDAAQSFWVVFHGTGGSVEVDEKNILTVTWSDGGSMEHKLPAGFWITEHPSPESVSSGDVVLIKRKMISMPGDRGGITL